jgi:hypothetical protein
MPSWTVYLRPAWKDFVFNFFYYDGIIADYLDLLEVTYAGYVSKSKKKDELPKPEAVLGHLFFKHVPSFFILVWYFFYFIFIAFLPWFFRILFFLFSLVIRLFLYVFFTFLFFSRFIFIVCVEGIFRVFKVLYDFIRLFFLNFIVLFSNLFLFLKYSFRNLDMKISNFLLKDGYFSKFRARLFLFYKYDFTLTSSILLKVLFSFMYVFLLFFWFLIYGVLKIMFMLYFTLYFFFLVATLKFIDYGFYDFLIFVVNIYKLMKYDW